MKKKKKKKKDNKQFLIETTRTVMANKENYYQENTVHTKNQIVSAKAVIQVDFPAYALSKHKANPSEEIKE